MNMSEIKTLIAVKKNGNISKTADELGLSQPALSKLIKTVENRLGAKLFARLPKGVQLTKEGEIYLKHFQQIENEFKEAQQSVNKLHSDYSDMITLSAHPIIANYFVASLEKEISKYPSIFLNYKFQNSRLAVEDVLKGSVDIAIAAEVYDFPDLIKTPLWNEYIGLYSKDGKAKDNLIYNSHMIDAQKYINKLKIKNSRNIDDYHILQSLLGSNDSMGLLPNSTADNDQNIKLVKRVCSKICIYLIYRADKTKTKGFRKLTNTLKRCTKPNN